jgi:CubicO group peptidase (beta-lactamase class C family)
MLVIKTIFDKLNMNRSSLFLTAEQEANLAVGYSKELQVRPKYDANDIFQGAGFIKSTLNDMLIFLKANIGLTTNQPADAMGLAQQTHLYLGDVTHDALPGKSYKFGMGLGWHIHTNSEGMTYWWHAGGTNGYKAYIGFDKANQFGVVILCNYEGTDIIPLGDDMMNVINKY